MPRVTPVRRATVVEKRARALCAKLARVSDDTPMEYRMVRLMARVLALDYETADTAISYAIQKGWLIGEGEPPHSISLRMRAASEEMRGGRGNDPAGKLEHDGQRLL
jgi:hypothetical protein